ncbi:hypothetical protein AgCh_031536 [Apium graveolens]
MANADTEADNAELKVPQTIFAFDTDDTFELRLFLKSLHVSYRDQTLENDRIKDENLDLKKRNDHLEYELIFMQETQKERDGALYIKEKLPGYANKTNSDKRNKEETEKAKPINIDVKLLNPGLRPSQAGIRATAEEAPALPALVTYSTPSDVVGPSVRSRWVHRPLAPPAPASGSSSPITYHVHQAVNRALIREQSPELDVHLDCVPIGPFQGVVVPSLDIQDRVRTLTQSSIDRARYIEPFISPETRAMQYQDLVDCLCSSC